MLVVFFELMVATGSILGGLGRVLEPSQPNLSMIFDVSKHASQTCSSCNKTTVFAMFYRLRNMPHTATEHVFCIAFKAFLDMVYGLLQKIPAGIHLLLFMTTLQRGGTCAAHGITCKIACAFWHAKNTFGSSVRHVPKSIKHRKNCGFIA